MNTISQYLSMMSFMEDFYKFVVTFLCDLQETEFIYNMFIYIKIFSILGYEITHCIRAVSLPPAESSRLSSGKNSTLVTCELCPPLT